MEHLFKKIILFLAVYRVIIGAFALICYSFFEVFAVLCDNLYTWMESYLEEVYDPYDPEENFMREKELPRFLDITVTMKELRDLMTEVVPTATVQG